MTIINSISDFLNGKSQNLAEVLKTLNIMKPRSENVQKTGSEKKYSKKANNKSDEDEQYELKTKAYDLNKGNKDSEPGLKRKRKLRFDFAKIDGESSIDEDIKEIQRINNEKGTSSNANFKGKANKKKDNDNEKEGKNNEKDTESFNAIDTVIDEMSKQFPDKTRNQILEAFKAVSFNIPNAYQYLEDPNVYASKY